MALSMAIIAPHATADGYLLSLRFSAGREGRKAKTPVKPKFVKATRPPPGRRNTKHGLGQTLAFRHHGRRFLDLHLLEHFRLLPRRDQGAAAVRATVQGVRQEVVDRLRRKGRPKMLVMSWLAALASLLSVLRARFKITCTTSRWSVVRVCSSNRREKREASGVTWPVHHR
jgi:hypothetical protein